MGFRTGQAASGAAFGVALTLALACSSADHGTGPSGSATQVTVSPDSTAVTVGRSQTLKAVARDASGNTLSGVQFFWSSSNSAVATVDQSGVVVSHSVGTANIAASTQGVSGVATITVELAPIASVVIAPSQATLRVNTTLQLADTAIDAAGAPITGQAATWASNNTSVATVDAAGLVIARAVGTARISATVSGVTGSTTITVTLVPIASIAIAPQNANVFVHQTTQLTATPRDSLGNPLANRPVAWKSLATGIATVSAGGVVTGVAAGAAVIQATAQGVIGEDAIKVTSAPVSSVVLSPATSQVFIGQTEQITAVVTDATGAPIPGTPVTFSSSKPTVATVNSSTGLVTGVGSGITTITGTSGGKSGQAAVAVFQVPVGSVTIQPADTTIASNGTAQMRATVVDSLGHPVSSPSVTWSSSPSGRVSNTGLVTPEPSDAGSPIVIQAMSGGKTGTAIVTVGAAPVASVTVMPADTTIAANQNAQMRVAVVNTLGQTIASPSVTWSSTPAGRVSASGVVTPQGTDANSPIQVQAASGGKSGTAIVNVTAPPPPPVASVTVMPADTTIAANQNAQMRVTVVNTLGQTVPSPVVTWASAPVGRVSGSGLVTALPGDTTIGVTATSGNVTGTATVNVSAPPPPPPPPPAQVGSVIVIPADTTIAVDETAQLQDTVKSTLGQPIPSAVTVWTSNPPGRVSPTGLVTPRPPDRGNVIAVVASSDGQSGTATVNISPSGGRHGQATTLTPVADEADARASPTGRQF